ncbi:MAG: ATP-binding protein [Lentimicrobiaceae bacterium]|nr:ATP-binding protein [Lentimicrobiaceae bacterium]
MKLENFRSYKSIQVDFDVNLTVIIGKNDVGKSTILESLEIFFNNEKVKMEMEDLCVSAPKREISISCVFEIEKDKKYTIDTIPISLKDEFLLNKEGNLEIRKEWDCSKGKLTNSSLKEYIVANYPACCKESPLVCMKNTELKKCYEGYKEAAENLGLVVRETTNSEMRQAIYKVLNVESLDFDIVNIPIDKIEGKDIWHSIKGDFPLYCLFQSDRANKDTDKEVQDPLKAITKIAIDEVADKLEEIKRQIEAGAKQIGEATIKKMEEMNPNLAKILKPEVSNKAWDSLFSFSFIGDDNIPMNKRGSGVRRLILLNYFRAEAERKSKNERSIIYAIEEPETSQHPNHQLQLIEALRELAGKDNCQVMITTHSPEIAKVCKNENLILIKCIDGYNQIIKDGLKLELIAETLGIMPYIGKLVICVEGENDRNFLLGINQNIAELRNIIDLHKNNISIIPMIGSNLKQWVNREYLKGSNVVEFHLYDKDNDEKYRAEQKKINNRENGSAALLTQMKEMENYIHPELYAKHFGIECSLTPEWKNLDVPHFVEQKIGKEKGLDESKIKRIANGVLSKQMTKELFTKLEVFEEVKGWFEQIKKMYESC